MRNERHDNLTGALNIAVLVLTAAAAVSGCGDDGDDSAAAAYCEGVARAEAKGEEIFATVDEDDPAAIREAEAEMVAYVEAEGFMEEDRLPDEIRDDATAFFAGMKARAEGGEATAEQQAAEERLLAWEDEHCTAAE